MRMANRIMIIGCCGSGKSTLAKRLAEHTGLPLIHLDREYYKPNWEKPEKEVWNQKILNLCNESKWIMDGNYISSMDVRMQFADTIIWLDINRYKCIYRAIKRVILPHTRQRTDMGEGCTERHDLEFYRFIWEFNKTVKPRIIELLKLYSDKNIIILKNNKDIKSYLNMLL
jgi:adenylate kinase family enzyme